MEKDYPFLTDYAKSDRSSCKGCKTNIPKDSLRLATYFQSPRFDAKITNWYHFKCFFKHNTKLKNIDDIKNIDSLRWEDQEKIKENINVTAKDAVFCNYGIEYCKAKTSKCAECKLVIEKEALRISCKETTVKWYHVECFHGMNDVVSKNIPDFDLSKINGFNKLDENDQENLITKFATWRTKKRAATDKGDGPKNKKRSKKEIGPEEDLKSQNHLLWQVRDGLQRELPKSTLVTLLEFNEQYVPVGEANLLNHVADCMVFGCIEHCPDCGGLLKYDSNQYQCTSNVNEWTKCLFVTKTVKRSEFKIPDDYGEYEVTSRYRYVPRVRILAEESSMTIGTDPLQGFSFVIDEVKFADGYTKANITKRIKTLGGTVTRSLRDLNDRHAALISNDAADGPKSFVSAAKTINLDVVTPKFLDNLETETFVEALKKHSCVPWGRSESEIRALKTAERPHWERKYVDDVSVRTMTLKGGAVVDPDSNLENKAHIYRDGKSNDLLNAVLGMVDIVRGSNSFYKLQLLESDTKKKWWVFRAWGRIGTTIGGNKTEKFDDLSDAIDNFEAIYFDKTKNLWANRNNFQKQPHRFYPMDVDYGEDLSANNLSTTVIESSLPSPVQQLITFVFDVESLKNAMLEFQIDLRKMPLGKLSKKQIDMSYSVLNELQQLLMGTEQPTMTQLLDASTRFYTLMPHDFGMQAPPIIRSLDTIKTKCEMIDNLREMEIAFKIINAGNGDNKIDKYYTELHNRINVVDRGSEIFDRINTYLRNTHAKTHSEYKLEIIEIFDLARDNEEKSFERFSQLPNRMMLWHGSRRSNWAGILSQGLRIAPPEAPPSGYMFGKGIYFADMVSKSANYCKVDHNGDGLLLLCEVALGHMTERTEADSDIQLAPNEHSCKGIGATMPNPAEDVVDEAGVVYPLGRPIKRRGHKGSLQYNEYIVYDVDQVRQRYLLRVKFQVQRR